MIVAETPENELDRLKALFELDILDTPLEADFDQLTELAASICGSPIALVSLLDDKRQWFKSHFGLDASETPRDYAFCAHAINQDEVFEICDSRKDERFHDNPLVTGDPRVIFYAGAPLVTGDGHKLGTVCVIDNEPRSLTDLQKKQLSILSRQVMALIESRQAVRLKNEAFNKLMSLTKNINEQNKELSQFTTRASHDIQGPIRQIKQLARFCQKSAREDSTEFIDDDCEKIISRCDDLSHFISSIFDLTGSSVVVENKREINLKKLVLLAISNNESLIDQYKVNVTYGVDVSSPFLSEPVRVLQILNNLISNAVKYSNPEKENKTVDVSVSEKNEVIVIKVVDNGLGIPKEFQSRLFDQFERFHTNSASGTGLGTSIIQKHVKMLLGGITFESDQNGTAFTVTLPFSS